MLVGVDVVTDQATVSKSARGAITGVVALRLGDVWFPESGWNDFVVVVLGWWARQAAALRAGHPARLDFMDGPYSVVARPENGLSSVACLRGTGEGAAILETGEVPTADLVAAIMRASRETLVLCEQNGWETPDTETLRQWAK
jgi:3-oxoacyl-ACP reductase-like protein